jgi:glycosyltransferase involved in cell wall biosynthesis
MKIAIVLNTSWNIYNFRMNFVRELISQGHEVHTIAPVDDYTKYLTELGCIHHRITMDSRGANPIKDSALVFELFWLYKRVRPDIVLHFTIKPNIYGTLAAAMLKIPVINNVCGLGTVFLKKNIVSAIAVLLYRISFRFANRVFFQNAQDRDLFIGKRLVSEQSADLVPGSGIDLQKFYPTPFKRNDKFTFLLISRLITDKGILEYIDAVKKLKAEGVDARFQILGAKDPEHKRGIKLKVIEGWIKSDTVEYLGTTNDVRSFIHQADCIVLPSYREGTPRTLLEAASSSKPIIATDVPGCNDVVVNDFNGLLCNLKDSNDLADKMKTMSSYEDSLLESFGKNGRAKMEGEYSESLVINKYLHALNEIKKAS